MQIKCFQKIRDTVSDTFFDFPQVKGYLMSSIVNSIYKFSHELPNDLGFRILGNYKMIRKT